MCILNSSSMVMVYLEVCYYYNILHCALVLRLLLLWYLLSKSHLALEDQLLQMDFYKESQ